MCRGSIPVMYKVAKRVGKVKRWDKEKLFYFEIDRFHGKNKKDIVAQILKKYPDAKEAELWMVETGLQVRTMLVGEYFDAMSRLGYDMSFPLFGREG